MFGKFTPGLALRKSRLWRLYFDGFERLEKEFDVIKIIKGIRDVKIITKDTIMDKFTKVKV